MDTTLGLRWQLIVLALSTGRYGLGHPPLVAAMNLLSASSRVIQRTMPTHGDVQRATTVRTLRIHLEQLYHPCVLRLSARRFISGKPSGRMSSAWHHSWQGAPTDLHWWWWHCQSRDLQPSATGCLERAPAQAAPQVAWLTLQREPKVTASSLACVFLFSTSTTHRHIHLSLSSTWNVH